MEMALLIKLVIFQIITKNSSGLISFGIQLALFVALLAYQWFLGARLTPQPLLLLALPLIILQISLLGLGFGIVMFSRVEKSFMDTV